MVDIGESDEEIVERARQALVKHKQYELRQFSIELAAKVLPLVNGHPRNLYKVADAINHYVLTGEHPDESRNAPQPPARKPFGGLHEPYPPV